VATRIQIDHRRCYKSGECYYNHPTLFAAGDDGFPVPRVASLETERQRVEARQAIEVCPSQAISLVEEAG
jgi:ferredoxin